MINEFTICLHCGCDKAIVENQMEALKPLEKKFNVKWNNRIDRREWYDTYSELINDSMVTSETEYVVLINDRTHPKPHEVEKILQCLDNGFAAATQYSVGFMGFSKQLLRTIGCWDQRFYGGGWEDDDFVLRLKLANLAYYESCEAEYDYHWKTPLQPRDGLKGEKSGAFFRKKWVIDDHNKVNGLGSITKVIAEENRVLDLGDSRPDIVDSWKSWDESVIGLEFGVRPNQGPSRTHHFLINNSIQYREVRDKTNE